MSRSRGPVMDDLAGMDVLSRIETISLACNTMDLNESWVKNGDSGLEFMYERNSKAIVIGR